jgi:hypothetical protein
LIFLFFLGVERQKNCFPAKKNGDRESQRMTWSQFYITFFFITDAQDKQARVLSLAKL